MCLLFISNQTTPGYRLAVAANRDEFLVRPTAPLGFLDEKRSILGGRDLQGGGTWLGISAGLRFAALTNYRDPAHNRAGAPSRGELVLDFLSGAMPAETYLRHLADRTQIYNGFNLIVGDDQGLFLLSNRSPGYQRLAPGYYGLSNHLLDTPWPKVLRGKELLRPHLQQRINVTGVFSGLADRHLPEDHLLPDTGVGLAWERLLSTIFIAGDTYGTRSSALLTVSDDNQVVFREKTHAVEPGQGEVVRQLSFDS
jgi:uncharacterized protein with NRDE domain